MNLSIKNGCIYLSKKTMMPGLYILYCTYSQYQSNDEKHLVNDEYQKYQTFKWCDRCRVALNHRKTLITSFSQRKILRYRNITIQRQKLNIKKDNSSIIILRYRWKIFEHKKSYDT